jgi:tryptophanyl-tRNA synthetase
MRPTGRLHIGHYFGALDNWVKLQNDPAYQCFFFVADWHALTSDYADTSAIAQNTIEIGIDWLAAGLDPARCTLFVQSNVPEHAELHLLLSMITPLGWLERVPTYKEQIENVKDKDLHTYGFLGYPLLQTADIVMYGAPDAELFVPVGEDQAPHVEMSREVVRRFNAAYGKIPEKLKGLALDHRLSVMANEKIPVEQVLREPDVLLTPTPRIPGTDGRKMSKSYGNAIMLSEPTESIRTKVRGMVTDPARKLRKDPGNPDVCPVFDWHKLFSSKDTIDRVNQECRTAEIGCVDCKGLMTESLVQWIEPVRARRQEYETHPGPVLEILDDGTKKARVTARETMARVREAVFAWSGKRKDVKDLVMG